MSECVCMCARARARECVCVCLSVSVSANNGHHSLLRQQLNYSLKDKLD